MFLTTEQPITSNTDGVFVSIGVDTELGGLFLRLKNLMVTELHLEWNILDQYSKDHMVPRVLRWDIHPQQGDSELEPWFWYFNEAVISFLADKKTS